ncbi:hypothetical protein [Methylobacterium sp. J-092]|uniref:hypothetical protein n=1 Tax=Methylobacterium sp. J-092 TaxID=2836667 RepID=UPI001FBB96A7|nr:hypothetical protein [Methylobacterium sp. J-092]MCJ2006745.1 hypothetical protein [Methylobacterium sp. J-092]
MRFAILVLAVLYPWAAIAGDGPWSAPNWAVSTTERHGPFTHATTLYVSPGRGHDVVEAHCSITDWRAPKEAVIVKAKGRAQMAQGLWCGGAGKLGTWCVDLAEGAAMRWYDKTICAGGPAQFSTGD